MKTAFTFLTLMALAGCSSLTTSYDYNKSTDFSKFQTYAFSDHALSLPEVQQLDRDRILEAIDIELVKRGFTKSNTPDALVDVFVKTEEEISATATNTGGYGRWGYGYGWGGGTTHVDYNKYTKGSLFINVIDASVEEIVWQGRGSKTLNENASPQRKESNIKSAIETIFLKYPRPKTGKK